MSVQAAKLSILSASIRQIRCGVKNVLTHSSFRSQNISAWSLAFAHLHTLPGAAVLIHGVNVYVDVYILICDPIIIFRNCSCLGEIIV